MITVRLLNSAQGGMMSTKQVREGTTLGDLFSEETGGGNPSNYVIRLNRNLAAAETVLRDNDLVSFSPSKVEGA